MDSSPKGFPVKMFDAKKRPVCKSDPIPVKAVTSCGHDYCYPFVKIRVAGRRACGSDAECDAHNPSSSFSIAKEVDMLDLKSTQSDWQRKTYNRSKNWRSSIEWHEMNSWNRKRYLVTLTQLDTEKRENKFLLRLQVNRSTWYGTVANSEGQSATDFFFVFWRWLTLSHGDFTRLNITSSTYK